MSDGSTSGIPPAPGRLRARAVGCASAGTVVSLLLAVGLAGCGEEGGGGAAPDAGLDVTVDTVGGVPRVVTAGEAPRWALEEVLTLGSIGAAGGERAPDEFGSVSSVTVGPDGRLWVADAMNAEIRVFRPGGTLDRVVGRQGQGPGEFGSLYSIAWADSVLLALDFGNGRVAEIAPDGSWLGSRRAPGRITGSPAMLRLHPVGPDEVVQWSVRSEPEFQRVWIVHGPDGVVTEFPQPEVRPDATSGVTCEGNGGIGWHDNPWAPAGYQHPAPGGRLWIGVSDGYRLALVEPSGDTVRVVERRVPPVPVSDEEWDEARADHDAFRESWQGAECTGSFERPEHKPAFRNVMVDTGGRLWVERLVEEGTLWEVFDGEGGLLGAVPGFEYSDRTAPHLSERHVAWVTRDTLVELPRVHLGRLHGGAGTATPPGT